VVHLTWDSFFTAEVGASAALAGLIFVGISINLRQILALPTITNRAFQALLVLVGSLSIESLMLVPGQSTAAQGVEVLVVALALVFALNWLEWSSWKVVPKETRRNLRAHSVELQFPAAFAVIAGALLVVGNSSAVYWLVPATLASFLLAIIEAWVITVEILR
jgi:TRAP-type C4-dicarboxylate transport system permease small subunit